MNYDKTYAEELVTAWEEVYKRGLSTFWILLVASQGASDIEALKARIATLSAGSFEVAEQSFYRSLRRLFESGMLDMSPSLTDKRIKLYSLSPLGYDVLQQFIHRNISPFQDEITTNAIKEVLAWQPNNPSASPTYSWSASLSQA